jgi:hypothetical protein
MSLEGSINSDQLRDILQDAHISVLLGAGASSGLFDVLGNVELALTELATEHKDSPATRLVRAAIYAKFFDSVLAKDALVLGRKEEANKVLETYKSFVRSLNQILLRRRSSILNKQVNIFTTNVDIAIETAMETLGFDVNDGFAGRYNPSFDTSTFGSLRYRRSAQYENLSEVPTFNLLKIHGSSSWKSEGLASQKITFDRDLAGVELVRTKLDAARAALSSLVVDKPIDVSALLAAAKGVSESATVKAFVSAYEALSIVNPTKEKFQTTVLNDNYYDLLRIFSNELEKANSLLLVAGFSFRDEHITHLIVRAANSNPTLRVIVFCYSREGLEEIESSIDESLVRNGNITLIGPPLATGGADQGVLSFEEAVAKHLTGVLKVDEAESEDPAPTPEAPAATEAQESE